MEMEMEMEKREFWYVVNGIWFNELFLWNSIIV